MPGFLTGGLLMGKSGSADAIIVDGSKAAQLFQHIVISVFCTVCNTDTFRNAVAKEIDDFILQYHNYALLLFVGIYLVCRFCEIHIKPILAPESHGPRSRCPGQRDGTYPDYKARPYKLLRASLYSC